MLQPVYGEYMELIRKNRGKGHDDLSKVVERELLGYMARELEEEEQRKFLANPEEMLRNFCQKGEVKKIARILYNLYEARDSFVASEREVDRASESSLSLFSDATHHVRNRLTIFMSDFDDVLHRVVHEYRKELEHKESEHLESLRWKVDRLCLPYGRAGRVDEKKFYFSILNPFFVITEYLVKQEISLPMEEDQLQLLADERQIYFPRLRDLVAAVRDGGNLKDLGEIVGHPRIVGGRIVL